MLQALKRFVEAGFVVAVLGKELARLIVGEAMPFGISADFGGGGFVCHAASIPERARAFR